MKIYFEDGELYSKNVNIEYHYIVDARRGYSNNMVLLDFINTYDNEASIYTNSLVALNNDYAWNRELKVPEIYLRKDGKWVRIDKLTEKQLREAHNIMKMYMSGMFKI